MRSGHHEKDLRYIKQKQNKMPRAKKTTTKKRPTRKAAPRRKAHDRRRSNPGDIFWTNVVNGFKKFLESPCK